MILVHVNHMWTIYSTNLILDLNRFHMLITGFFFLQIRLTSITCRKSNLLNSHLIFRLTAIYRMFVLVYQLKYMLPIIIYSYRFSPVFLSNFNKHFLLGQFHLCSFCNNNKRNVLKSFVIINSIKSG